MIVVGSAIVKEHARSQYEYDFFGTYSVALSRQSGYWLIGAMILTGHGIAEHNGTSKASIVDHAPAKLLSV